MEYLTHPFTNTLSKVGDTLKLGILDIEMGILKDKVSRSQTEEGKI